MGFFDEVDAASGAGGDWRRDPDGDDGDAGVVISRNRRDSSWCCAPATSYSCNEGFAVANNRGHFISVCVDHHVRCHQSLRLGEGTEISPEFRLEIKLLDSTVGSLLLNDVVHGYSP